MTMPAMAPPESLCECPVAAEDAVVEEDEVDEEAVADGITDPVPVVDETRTTPRAKPSYGEAKAWALVSVSVKIDVASRAELS